MLAAKSSKSTKVSARNRAAAKAKMSNSPRAGNGLPRQAREPALLPNYDGDAPVQAYIVAMPGDSSGGRQAEHNRIVRVRIRDFQPKSA
jgi:hypothetical protein